MNGVLYTGACGDSTGAGVAYDGVGSHAFSVRWLGSQWTMTGGVTGTLNVTPVPGESCLFPGSGANTFLVTGSFTLT